MSQDPQVLDLERHWPSQIEFRATAVLAVLISMLWLWGDGQSFATCFDLVSMSKA